MSFIEGSKTWVYVSNEVPASERKGEMNITKRPIIQCRNCKGDHLTVRCPGKVLKYEEPVNKALQNWYANHGKRSGFSDVAPDLRYGCIDDDGRKIRITNLSENVSESDLHGVFSRIGEICRVFVSKDRVNGKCRGFAFITYKRKEDAERAIRTFNGFRYDQHTLNVGISK